MSDFFRFPHTPHIAWLSSEMPRDDKVLTNEEAKSFLNGYVVVEEKLDGANLGFSLGENSQLLIQNRGQYLDEPYSGQFIRLKEWLSIHKSSILSTLAPGMIIFGEWCAARHSLEYRNLPDWFLLFDVYERTKNKFWSTTRRDILASEIGISIVPKILEGKTNLIELMKILEITPSHYRDGLMEGEIIRLESKDWCERRAKLVSSSFIQTIDEHWRRRQIEWNRVIYT